MPIVCVLIAAVAAAEEDYVQVAAAVSAEDGTVELLDEHRAHAKRAAAETAGAELLFATENEPVPIKYAIVEPPPPSPPIELQKQTIQFINASPEPVELYWVEPSGSRRFLNSIAPTLALDVGFFAGHVFEWHAPGAADSPGGWPKPLKYSRTFLGMKRQVWRGRALSPGQLLTVDLAARNLAETPIELWLRSTPSAAHTPSRKLLSLASGQSSEIKLYAGAVVEWVRPEDPERVEQSIVVEAYMNQLKYDAAPPHPRISTCGDRYPERCARDAARGECQRNPGWMTVFCGASCGTCALQDPVLRCAKAQLNMSQSDRAWGDVDATPEVRTLADMFASLAGEGTRPSRISERYPHVKVRWLSREPPILHFENFVSDDEATALVTKATGWTRSTDAGDYNSTLGITQKKISSTRTSNHAWCRADCEADDAVRRLLARIEEFVSISRANFEMFQVLRYTPGEEYARHHDFGGTLKPTTPAGGRILTFFLYLSDVELGGATSFTDLKPPLSVAPKKGSAILWSSVLDPPYRMRQDARTFHAALPVEKGIKLAANTWISLNPFRIAQKWGCTGSFDEL